MAVKYGEFQFPAKFGFHGSAGETYVKPYMRKYARGGKVDIANSTKMPHEVPPAKGFADYAHGGTVKQKYAKGGHASTPQHFAFGGFARDPKVNKAIHAKAPRKRPVAARRGLGALGQAAGPSMTPLGAPMGGSPIAAPQQLGAPMGMKRGGHRR